MEPTKGYDKDKQDRLMAIFKELKKDHVPLWLVLMVLASQLDDMVSELNTGKIKTIGQIQKLKELAYVKFLVGEAAVHLEE